MPKKRAYARSDFPRPRKQLAEQGKFEHAVRAEDELELSFGSLATLTLGQRVELTAVIHPRGQRLVCENQLIRDPELVCDAHDARLCCERVGTLLPDEAVVVVGFDVATHIVSRLGEHHVDARTVQVVRKRRPRDARAHHQAVSDRVVRRRWRDVRHDQSRPTPLRRRADTRLYQKRARQRDANDQGHISRDRGCVR